jgi:hypothetical protein
VQSDFIFPSRTTASNGIVAAKPSSTVVGPSHKRKPTSKLADPDQDDFRMSEEDDSLEKELAMSSPVKGCELRAAMKVVHFSLYFFELIVLHSVYCQRQGRTTRHQAS